MTALPVVPAEAEGQDRLTDPQERLGDLLADIEALHEELEGLEARLARPEVAGAEDDVDDERMAGAEDLARRIAEEVVRRRRASMAANPAREDRAAKRPSAPVAPVDGGRAALGAIRGAPASSTPRVATPGDISRTGTLVGVPARAALSTAPTAEPFVVPAAETSRDEPAAATSAQLRRLARPAEICLHLAVLLALIAVAAGAFR